MPEGCDAKLLQVLVRQTRENRLVYLILAECRLILPEAQAPQPDHDVHDGRPSIMGGVHLLPGKRECPGWRWVSQGFAKTLRSNGVNPVFNPFVKIRAGIEFLCLAPMEDPF